MAKAIWNGVILAESQDTILVEGNHYFPRQAVSWEYLHESPKHTICTWKGQASYYHIQVNGRVNHDAAWYYPTPNPAARHITDRIAFWRGVKVES